MFDDLAAFHAENVAGCEVQGAAGRRDTEIHAVVGAGMCKACRDVGFVGDYDFGRHLQVGQTGQAPLEEGDTALLVRHACRRRRCSADLMVHVAIREQAAKASMS